jgi:hypothetical protein
MEILFILVFFIGSGWLLGKLVAKLFFPKSKNYEYPVSKNSKTIINNHITENHLHITENQLKELNNY